MQDDSCQDSVSVLRDRLQLFCARRVDVGDQVLLTVGNVMMGDDAAGPRLAALLQRSPAPGWQVVDGGSAPENVVHRVRAMAPERTLVVDSAEMELGPGEVCLVDEHLIVERFITTTHNLPVSFLIEALRQTIPEVHFLGIQPVLVSFGYPLSAAVERAIMDIHARLQQGAPIDSWPRLEELTQAQSAGGCS
jgi:hydrogenase 3 maturation protease